MQHEANGRRYAAAALGVYAVAVLFAPATWGGSLMLAPLGVVFAAVAWYRDRPSKVRTVAFGVTTVALTLMLALLGFHLVWGDLS